MRFLRHARAIVALPTIVTIAVPLVLLLTLGPARADAGLAIDVGLAALGVLVIAAGLALIGWTVYLFDREGRGTLAPWDAPTRLVVRGPYLHVRNPMISGVLFVLLGEVLLFRSPVLLVWFLAFFALNQTYIPLWEEPDLQRRFGSDYVRYKRNVRRWLPRLHAWRGNDIA
jgi:protein-S-isoprenylcysteine O-methyltransferase Ste14